MIRSNIPIADQQTGINVITTVRHEPPHDSDRHSSPGPVSQLNPVSLMSASRLQRHVICGAPLFLGLEVRACRVLLSSGRHYEEPIFCASVGASAPIGI